jgi:toxin ParE1/3/4
MRIVFTEEALRDLDAILDFIAAQYPAIAPSFQRRLRTVLQRIGKWPKSAEEVEQRPAFASCRLSGIPTEYSTKQRTTL